MDRIPGRCNIRYLAGYQIVNDKSVSPAYRISHIGIQPDIWPEIRYPAGYKTLVYGMTVIPASQAGMKPDIKFNVRILPDIRSIITKFYKATFRQID